jgi:hypothetical protein
MASSGRSRWEGWEEAADYALDWALANATHPAAIPADRTCRGRDREGLERAAGAGFAR